MCARALLATALLCALVGPGRAAGPTQGAGSTARPAQVAGEGWNAALESFFGTIDQNGDGQIGTAEALRYIGANFDSPDIQHDLTTAAKQMSRSLDGSDSDSTISREEVESHLRKLLRGNKVTEWVKHSAQMPQYANAFKENSVTSMDFPMLVADGGAALEADLGVRSKLHREQLMRALKRVILGIGSTPGPPVALQCQPLACDRVAVRWEPPQKLGSPPLHKYRLERQVVQLGGESVPAPQWEAANEDLDDELTAWVDSSVQVGVLRYRLTAWNAMGWSEPALSPECDTANASLPCPPGVCRDPAACVDDSLASEAAATHAVSAAWRLAYSCAGILLVGLLVAWLFVSSQQRETGKGLAGLFVPEDALLRQSPKQAAAQQQAQLSRHGSALDLSQAAPARSSVVSEANGLLQTPSRRQLLHVDSGASRSSGREFMSEGSSPRRRFAGGAQPSDANGLELEALHADPVLPSLRVHNSQRGLSGEQDVLWLDGDGVATSGPLAEALASPHPTNRHSCGFPGCQRGLHPLFNPRAAMTSHYCSICQNVFCQHHTRHSPHGKLGSCGMESKCICCICYDELPRTTQERLEKSNRLRSKRDAQQAASSSSVTVDTQAPERGGRSETQRPSMLRRGGSSGSEHASAARFSVESAGPEGGTLRRRRSGQQNWSLLRAVFGAAGRFRDAGRSRRRAAA